MNFKIWIPLILDMLQIKMVTIVVLKKGNN